MQNYSYPIYITELNKFNIYFFFFKIKRNSLIKLNLTQVLIVSKTILLLPGIWAILDRFLAIFSPFITIISHSIATGFEFQSILVILNPTDTLFQYWNSAQKSIIFTWPNSKNSERCKVAQVLTSKPASLWSSLDLVSLDAAAAGERQRMINVLDCWPRIHRGNESTNGLVIGVMISRRFGFSSFVGQQEERGFIIKKLSHNKLIFRLIKPVTCLYLFHHLCRTQCLAVNCRRRIRLRELPHRPEESDKREWSRRRGSCYVYLSSWPLKLRLLTPFFVKKKKKKKSNFDNKMFYHLLLK